MSRSLYLARSNMSFYVFILQAIFCGTIFFFHFLGLCVASKVILMCSLLVHSTSLLGQRSLQKRICAEVIFCSKKIVVTVLAVFLSFWS